jgi:hypothetical protein
MSEPEGRGALESTGALTRLSTRPNSVITAATRACAWATWATSASTDSALVPAAVSSPAAR